MGTGAGSLEVFNTSTGAACSAGCPPEPFVQAKVSSIWLAVAQPVWCVSLTPEKERQVVPF